jgi:glutamate mutase epsilon subunit
MDHRFQGVRAPSHGDHASETSAIWTRRSIRSRIGSLAINKKFGENFMAAARRDRRARGAIAAKRLLRSENDPKFSLCPPKNVKRKRYTAEFKAKVVRLCQHYDGQIQRKTAVAGSVGTLDVPSASRFSRVSRLRR